MATSGTISTNDFNGRYLAFTWALSSQDVETNSSVISWSLRGAGGSPEPYYDSGAFKVVINGVTVFQSTTRIKLYNGTLVASGSATINHDASGEKTFAASIQGAIYYTSVNVSGSASFSLPTIDRYGTIIEAADFTDEGNPSLKFSNPNNYSLRFELLAGDVVITRNIENAQSPYIFTLSDTERNALRGKAPNSNTLEVTYQLKTIDSGITLKTDSAAATMTIVNASPIISGGSYEDTNPDTIAITADSSKIIQGQSLVSFGFISLTAIKGAALSSISITVNAVTVTSPLSGSSTPKTVAFGAVNSSANVEALIVLTDSRGNKETTTIGLDMLSYALPTALVNIKRVNNYSSDISILVNASYSPLGGSNSLSLTYQYKETTSATYSQETAISDGVESVITLDNTKAYNFKVNVADLIGSTTYNLTIDRGIPIFYVDRLNNSVGVNCYPKYENSIEVGGKDLATYHSGEVVTMSDVIVSGYILNSSTSLRFTLPLDKPFNQCSFTSLSLDIIGGGSGESIGEVVGAQLFTITTSKAAVNLLTVEVENTDGYSASDLTAVAVELSASLSFS